MRVPSSILADARQRAEEASRDGRVRALLIDRLLGRPDERWSLARLATTVDLPAARVDAELAALLVDREAKRLGPNAARLRKNVLRRHVDGWSCGPVGVYERLVVPSAYELERWVHQGDVAALDAALAATKTPMPRAIGDVPLLRWRTGERLSVGAHAWYLAQRLAGTFVHQTGSGDAARPVRGAAGLIEPALHDEDTVALARWVLSAKLPAECRARVPRSPAALDFVGRQVEAGELSRSRALDMMGSGHAQARRWAFRWGELRSPRYPDVIADDRIEGRWPRRDDATGTLRQWATWIGEVLERAMIEQRAWRLDDFREAYLDHPVAARVAEGLVFVVGGLPVVFVHGRPHDGDGPIEVQLGGALRVAHPAEGVEHWPMPLLRAPFSQRDRPVLEIDELPAPPREAVPLAIWKRRIRALRLVSDEEARGGTTAELWLVGPYRVHVEHAGYGPGHGGARPIENIEVTVRMAGQPPLAKLGADHRSGWGTLPRWLVSEAAQMLRVLYGLAPLPPRMPSR